jgi:hypothetical protein
MEAVAALFLRRGDLTGFVVVLPIPIFDVFPVVARQTP